MGVELWVVVGVGSVQLCDGISSWVVSAYMGEMTVYMFKLYSNGFVSCNCMYNLYFTP